MLSRSFQADSRWPASLMGLPTELRDMIFLLVFYCLSTGKLVPSGRDWDNNELKKQRLATSTGSTYTVRRFEPKVSEFLVSKQYFPEAAQAYVTTMPLIWNNVPFTTMCAPGIYAAFAKEVTLPFHLLHFAAHMPNLRILRARISSNAFGGRDEIMPVFRENLAEAEMRLFLDDMPFSIRYHDRLFEFQLLPEDLDCAESSRKEMRKANVKTMESVARSKLTTPGSGDVPKPPLFLRPTSGRELYPGSAVSWSMPQHAARSLQHMLRRSERLTVPMSSHATSLSPSPKRILSAAFGEDFDSSALRSGRAPRRHPPITDMAGLQASRSSVRPVDDALWLSNVDLRWAHGDPDLQRWTRRKAHWMSWAPRRGTVVNFNSPRSEDKSLRAEEAMGYLEERLAETKAELKSALDEHGDMETSNTGDRGKDAVSPEKAEQGEQTGGAEPSSVPKQLAVPKLTSPKHQVRKAWEDAIGFNDPLALHTNGSACEAISLLPEPIIVDLDIEIYPNISATSTEKYPTIVVHHSWRTSLTALVPAATPREAGI